MGSLISANKKIMIWRIPNDSDRKKSLSVSISSWRGQRGERHFLEVSR